MMVKKERKFISRQQLGPVYKILLLAVYMFVLINFFLSAWHQNSFETAWSVLFILLLSILFLTFFCTRLHVWVEDKFLRFTLFPLLNKSIALSDIQHAELIQVSHFKQYLGVGMRWSGKEWAYFLAHEKMLRVILKSGKSLIIGLQKDSDEMEY